MTRERAYELIRTIRDVVDKEVDLSKFFEDYSEKEKAELEEDFCGVSNGFLSEIVYAITGYKVEVYGEVENLFLCPCCGFKTLSEPYDPEKGTGYDICPYCNWEDDGTTDVKSFRSLNKGSILDYRKKLQKNFNRYYINKWLKG